MVNSFPPHKCITTIFLSYHILPQISTKHCTKRTDRDFDAETAQQIKDIVIPKKCANIVTESPSILISCPWTMWNWTKEKSWSVSCEEVYLIKRRCHLLEHSQSTVPPIQSIKPMPCTLQIFCPNALTLPTATSIRCGHKRSSRSYTAFIRMIPLSRYMLVPYWPAQATTRDATSWQRTIADNSRNAGSGPK